MRNRTTSTRRRLSLAATLLLLLQIVGVAIAPAALAAPPTITSFSPSAGPPGTTVTITGTEFTGTTAVRFAGLNATSFTVVSPTQITAVVPNNAETGAIQVVDPEGTATSSSSFVVTAAGPTITSFTPTSGAPGTSVTINGTNFTGATQVLFNGVSATFSITNSTRIIATVPAGATTGRITVSTPSGSVLSATNFTVTQGAPVISSFTPANGPIGTSVIITGSGFLNTVTVKFDGVNAPFTVNSNTQITATVPNNADTGRITVTTSVGTGTSATDFVVTQVPTITSFTPTSGGAGTTVTINGTNFTAVSAVTFNGTAAQFTVNSSTRITATVPTGATTGRIRVTNSAGTATSPTDFTAAPSITSFSPGSGLPGATVVITGQTFTGATAVAFNGVLSPTFTVDSPTQITATVPTGATTGKISVTGPNGTGVSTTDFVIIQIHDRQLSFRLRGHLLADGQLTVTDGFAGCVSGVTIFVQRKIGDSWQPLKFTTTAENGTWAVQIPDNAGRYRARVLRAESTTDICRAATSARRIHRHP